MATWTTYDTVGAKEDISDVISNISPTKTPFQSGIGRDKVTQKRFYWQEDSLRAVTDNNNAEGFEATENAPDETVMRDNITQILQETIKVSGTTDATSFYGRAKESAYQMAKSAAQVKRDLENALVGTAQSKVTPSDNTTNRKMAGYQALLNTSGTSNVIYTGAGPAALSETKLLETLQTLYDKGADPSVISVTPTNSLVVADFAKASGRYRTIDGGKTIVNAVNLYVSPFGEQRVILNRFQKALNTLVYDPENWKLAVLRNWFRETLAKTGDSVKMMIVGEFSLKHKNFSASADIVEGTTGF
jgi:hypothetical protein